MKITEETALKVGDRVETTSSYDGWYSKCEKGRIIATDSSISGVEFDNCKPPFAHDCGGIGKKYSCLWVDNTSLRRIAPTDWIMIIRPDKADPDVTVGILKVDGKEVRRETVKRYYKDEYNITSAIEMAAAKMVGRCIRDFAKPPVKEVTRQAEVGEWIKIVRPAGAGGRYKTGDILQVHGLYPGVSAAWILFPGGEWMVGNPEYVVLEGYTPQ